MSSGTNGAWAVLGTGDGDGVRRRQRWHSGEDGVRRRMSSPMSRVLQRVPAELQGMEDEEEEWGGLPEHMAGRARADAEDATTQIYGKI